MQLDKLVELGDIINCGKFHCDCANSFGSIPGILVRPFPYRKAKSEVIYNPVLYLL
jgi:hypothetical protein